PALGASVLVPAVPSILLSFPTRRSSDLDEKALSFLLLAWTIRSYNLQSRAAGALTDTVTPPSAAFYRGRTHRCFPGMIFLRLKLDRKSTRLNSSHVKISYAVVCVKKTHT